MAISSRAVPSTQFDNRQVFVWTNVVPGAALALMAAIAIPWLVVSDEAAPAPNLLLQASLEKARPELREQLQFMLAVSLVPATIWGIAVFRRYQTVEIPKAAAVICTLAVQLMFTIFVVAAVVYQEFIVARYFGPWSLILLVSGFMAILLYYQRLYQSLEMLWDEVQRRTHPVILKPLPIFLVVTCSVVALLPSVYRDNPGQVSVHYRTHTLVLMGEFAAVQSGLTPLIDFFPQYQNLLSFPLLPVFHVFGLRLTTFSLAMATLSFLGFMIIGWAFARLTKNLWLACGMFLLYLGLSITVLRAEPSEYPERLTAFTYYAVGPVRYFGTWLTLAALVLCLGNSSAVWKTVLGGVATLAAVNNLEFGVPALAASWLSLLLTTSDGPMPRVATVVSTLGSLLLGSALALSAYIGFIYLRTHSWPGLGASFLFQQAFARSGFMMLPTPVFGLHWVIYITFMAAIGRSLTGGEEDRAIRGVLFFSGLFGAGAGIYYAGRSHTEVLGMLFPAWSFALVLLTYSSLRDSRVPGGYGQEGSGGGRWTLPQWLLVAAILLCVVQLRNCPNIVQHVRRIASTSSIQWPVTQRYAKLIERWAKSGDRVVIVYPLGHWLATEAGVKNVYPFVEAESLILQSQLDMVMELVDRHNVQYAFGHIRAELQDRFVERGFVRSETIDDFDVWKRQ